MKIFIVGGTGFLGYFATLEFLRRGHEVATMSLPDITLGDWFPQQVKVLYGDIFKKTDAELIDLFKGYDVMVYAVGPDDRVIPKAPAYEFFHDRLVVACGRVVAAARNAGVTRCAVLNSYFAYFARIRPELQLTKHHPYIRVRVEQAERVLQEDGDQMSVSVLELPYIFGIMPGRPPLWKEALLDKIFRMNPVMYPKGGSTMVTVETVADAIVGVIEKKKSGRFIIADENLSWKKMLDVMLKAIGMKRKVLTVPTFMVTIFGLMMKREERKEGKESGLDHGRLFKDIQSQEFYVDADPIANELGYRRGGVIEAIQRTVKECYPNGFK
jgi:nucleoside-diphosphate-sugar epimerase